VQPGLSDGARVVYDKEAVVILADSLGDSKAAVLARRLEYKWLERGR